MQPRVLVVVYSHTGTAAQLARQLCAQHDWSLGEIFDQCARTGWVGTLRCVLDTLFERSPAIRYEGADPAEFDRVVLIAPIWLYQLAGPMRSFVDQYRFALSQVAVIAVMGGEGGPNAANEIAHHLGRNPVASASFTTRTVQSGDHLESLTAFAAQVTAAPSQTERRPEHLWAAQLA